MPFKRDSLAVLHDRIYANYTSLLRPLGKTPRQNLLKVFSSVDAGIYHQLLGDMDFLAKQIFPDTAEGQYLREHWSSKTPPLYAIAASGEITVTGMANKTIPAGVVYELASGERYYLKNAYKLNGNGQAIATVYAENPGQQGNLAAGEKLKSISALPVGIDSEAVVSGNGITGGTDAETDEEYLVRVLATIRNPNRYGKTGDFASWARDASPEVSAAWEFKNFGFFGVVLIVVINGNQLNGAHPVNNLAVIQNYLNEVAPPIPFEVRSASVKNIYPTASLPPQEDTQANRVLVESRIKSYMQVVAMPGVTITAGALRQAVIDGVTIIDITVKLSGSTIGNVTTTILEYPYIGGINWE